MSPEQAIRDELMALLRYANKSEVARALNVTPQAVINWAEGKNTSPARLLQVRRLYGLPDTTKEPPGPPEWYEGLRAELVSEIRENREFIVAALSGRIAEAVAEALAGLQIPPPDAQAPASSDRAG